MPNDIAPAAPAGAWHLERDAVAACLTAPVLAALPELGVIAVEGPDAAAFLQAQLTNDVAHLDMGTVQLNGYCSAKGRLYAVFNNWRSADAVYLQLPREILPGILKRLSMFVLRAKARLRDASEDWTAVAVFGCGATAELEGVAAATLRDAGTFVASDGARIVRLPAGAQVPERFLLLLPTTVSAQWRGRFAPLRSVPSGAFWWTQIDAAVPMVFAATQEKFVPQMINLEVLGGVNFKKGCYPGQEVVARSQYLGKLRRRMHVAQVDGETYAGDDVFAADTMAPIGTVVMAASAPTGGMDVLFECPAERVDGATLHVGGPTGPALKVRPLPYALIDVTA